MPDKQTQEISQRHAELLAQLRLQSAFEQQRGALEVEINETLARYRVLKGITPATDSAPTAATQG